MEVFAGRCWRPASHLHSQSRRTTSIGAWRSRSVAEETGPSIKRAISIGAGVFRWSPSVTTQRPLLLFPGLDRVPILLLSSGCEFRACRVEGRPVCRPSNKGTDSARPSKINAQKQKRRPWFSFAVLWYNQARLEEGRKPPVNNGCRRRQFESRASASPIFCM